MTAGRDGGACPRCGARVEPGQEYCLDCGLRLPVAEVGAWRRHGVARGPAWLWPILAALLVAAVMTGVAILIATGGDSEGAFFEATGPATVSIPGGETTTAPPTTTAEPTTATTAATGPATEPSRPELVDWPPSQNGYTVVIASLPATDGRADAIRRAREALRSDLPDVGVLDSGEFSSLHPGYYVVFSGIYDDQRSALGGLGRVQRLYPAAYIRQISR